MNNDSRTTSEQLYIPNFLIVGGSQSLLLRCFHASKTLGLAIKVCTAAEATVIVARRHPIAIVVPNDVFAGAAYELVAVARDVRSALLPVDPEVSVRELEAMLADELLNRPGRRVFAAGSAGDIVSVKTGTRVRRENAVVVWRPLDRGQGT